MILDIRVFTCYAIHFHEDISSNMTNSPANSTVQLQFRQLNIKQFPLTIINPLFVTIILTKIEHSLKDNL